MEGNKHGIAKYFHGLLNEVLLSFRKFYRDEVGGANTKTSFSNLYETPTLQKVLANLQRYKYVINDKHSEIPQYGGYINLGRKEKINPQENLRKFAAENSDEYPMSIIRQSFIFKFLTATNKSLTIFNMKKIFFDLDSNSDSTYNVKMGCFPFYS